jgi:hypothetical protein
MHSSEYAGMDPINERKMFQQLVRAASQINTPQWVTVQSTHCTACRSADLPTSDNLPILLPADASFWRPSFYLIWSTAMPAAFSTLWTAHGLRSQQKVLVSLMLSEKENMLILLANWTCKHSQSELYLIRVMLAAWSSGDCWRTVVSAAGHWSAYNILPWPQEACKV